MCVVAVGYQLLHIGNNRTSENRPGGCSAKWEKMFGYGIFGPRTKRPDWDRPTVRELEFVRTGVKIRKKNQNIFPDRCRG